MFLKLARSVLAHEQTQKLSTWPSVEFLADVAGD